MYLQNKYTTMYHRIVINAKKRILSPEIYTEKHHIIPKSLGGDNSPENIVTLTPKEHFICHLLLPKMVERDNKRKMKYASWMMIVGIKRYKPSARIYEMLRNQMAEANKERIGPNLGKKLSDEWKQNIKNGLTEEIKKRISNARKGQKSSRKGVKLSEESKKKISLSRGSDGRRFGPHTEETVQKLKEARAKQIFTDETRKKMSETKKGKKFTEEHKKKIADANIGKRLSEETKRKISETLKAKNIDLK
jgi:NUMOD3 motif